MHRHPALWGFVGGLATAWVWHHFVRPLPGGGATGAFSG